MSVQVKRGSTSSWKLGPELVDFGSLSVNGADSTIHCEGKTMSMYIGTDSASDFDGDGTKSLGLWLIKSGELSLPAGSYRISLYVSKIKSSGGSSEWGTRITIGDGNEINQHTTATTPTEKTITISSDENVCCHIFWGEEVLVAPIKISLSIRKVNEYESLLPGQIGCEYLDENGSTAIKIGPKTEDGSATKWNDIPYVGQVLPPSMYVDNVNQLPQSAPVGTIMFVRRT